MKNLKNLVGAVRKQGEKMFGRKSIWHTTDEEILQTLENIVENWDEPWDGNPEDIMVAAEVMDKEHAPMHGW
jgi:hypothetical protein